MGSQRLVFDGDIELLDDGSGADSFWFEAVEGISFGQAVPVTAILTSLLRDGALVAKTGDDNREVAIPFRVRGSDLLSLAEGEARIARAIGKRSTLAWTPPDGIGPTTVFDVMTSDLDNPPMDDLSELRNQRTYTLRLTCLPFGRSVTKIVDNAGTPPSSGTVFLNCESTTGWSTLSSGSGSHTPEYVVDTAIFSEGAGSLRSRAQTWQTNADATSTSTTWDKVDLSQSTGTGGYLSIAHRVEYTLGSLQIWMTTSTGGRQQITNAMATKRDANGLVHYTWPVDGGLTVTALDFITYQTGPVINGLSGPTNLPHHVWYDDFEMMASATSEHQIVKQHDVQGSARTTGSLHIAAPTDTVALDKVLVITAPTNELPAGFQPDGAQWVVQGATTTDSTALHGQFYTPSTTAYDSSATAPAKPIFDVPVGMLTPGPYTIVALAKSTTASLSFGVQAQLRIGSTNTGPLSTAETTTPVTANAWGFVSVGMVYLPPLPMQSADTTAKVRLLFKGATFSDIYMIPAWQVDGRAVADFTIVDCGSGTVAAGGPSSNLWIDSPAVENKGLGAYWRGPTSDRLNAQSAWPDAKKPGIHTFRPGSLTNFVVSTGAQGPTSTLEYFPACLTNSAH